MENGPAFFSPKLPKNRILHTLLGSLDYSNFLILRCILINGLANAGHLYTSCYIILLVYFKFVHSRHIDYWKCELTCKTMGQYNYFLFILGLPLCFTVSVMICVLYNMKSINKKMDIKLKIHFQWLSSVQ